MSIEEKLKKYKLVWIDRDKLKLVKVQDGCIGGYGGSHYEEEYEKANDVLTSLEKEKERVKELTEAVEKYLAVSPLIVRGYEAYKTLSKVIEK